MKASLHGPNRKQKRQIKTKNNQHHQSTAPSSNNNDNHNDNTNNDDDNNITSSSIPPFMIRSLERLPADCQSKTGLGDACLFNPHSDAGRSLLRRHWQLIRANHDTAILDDNDEVDNDDAAVIHRHPIYIHFHDVPVYILRAVPLQPPDIRNDDESNVMYLSRVHGHNHKVCEDTTMTVTCCSGIICPPLSHVGVEVHPRTTTTATTTTINNDDDDDDTASVSSSSSEDDDDDEDDETTQQQQQQQQQSHCNTFHSKDIAREIMNQTFRSIITVDEIKIITLKNVDLVCRISGVMIQTTPDDDCDDDDDIIDEPYRGLVDISTVFYVAASHSSSPKTNDDDDDNVTSSSFAASPPLVIINEQHLPEGRLPDDVIHITTSDGEWFPVRKILLTPCIKLTKYVQSGRGKYAAASQSSSTKNNDNDVVLWQLPPPEERSVDAPTDDGRPHVKINVDCCTFDRVLLFLISLWHSLRTTRRRSSSGVVVSSSSSSFELELSEVNALRSAAEELGLHPLLDLCDSRTCTFTSRVRNDSYIRFSEVIRRNGDDQGELLIVLDGMVLDITRWIDEHPGGSSIIPNQALNRDCTVFFEIYHVSRQALLYLKEFYIGELAPEDIPQLKAATKSRLGGDSGRDEEPSQGFLNNLREFCNPWRVKIKTADKKIHKSL